MGDAEIRLRCLEISLQIAHLRRRSMEIPANPEGDTLGLARVLYLEVTGREWPQQRIDDDQEG